MYDLRNKVVFITGASSGIGAACAEAFAPLAHASSSARAAWTSSNPSPSSFRKRIV